MDNLQKSIYIFVNIVKGGVNAPLATRIQIKLGFNTYGKSYP
ncbi:MAG: hypothetical protein K0S24_2392 [Sphingobacterium sp.]|jgi:hypothetical protein|nr:hypothetical protein [Sphingobacterium sp.]